MHEDLPIVGRRHGYTIDDEAVVAEINESRPDMLFVALGSPRQEKWIAQYRTQLEVPFCMGVGGSFDVLSGQAHLAPWFIRKTGMEWLYRLLREPKRYRRQAVLPVFVLGLLWHYFSAKVTPHDPHDMTLKSLKRGNAQSLWK